MIQIEIVLYSNRDFFSNGNEFIFDFQFQTNHENDSMTLIVMAFQVFYAFVVVFITCELGERLMSEFSDIANVIGQFDWYLLPPEVQKTLPTIIINAQQAVNIECFGSMNTCRESFQQVKSATRKEREFHIMSSTN